MKDCFVRFAIAYDLLSADDVTYVRGGLMYGFLERTKAKIYSVICQNSDDAKVVGFFFLSSGCTDLIVLEQCIMALAKRNGIKDPRFGLRTKNNKAIPAPPRGHPWALAPNKPVYMEAARAQCRPLKKVLCKYWNAVKNWKQRPNFSDLRFIPEPEFVLAGSAQGVKRQSLMTRHSTILSRAALIRVEFVKKLDDKIQDDGFGNFGDEPSLRTILMQIHFPYDQRTPGNRLFLSIDSGYLRNGVHCCNFVTIQGDREEYARNFVQVLPAFINSEYGPHVAAKWFYSSVQDMWQGPDQIEFGRDQYGEWDGTWVTADQLEQDAILEEETLVDLSNVVELEEETAAAVPVRQEAGTDLDAQTLANASFATVPGAYKDTPGNGNGNSDTPGNDTASVSTGQGTYGQPNEDPTVGTQYSYDTTTTTDTQQPASTSGSASQGTAAAAGAPAGGSGVVG